MQAKKRKENNRGAISSVAQWAPIQRARPKENSKFRSWFRCIISNCNQTFKFKKNLDNHVYKDHDDTFSSKCNHTTLCNCEAETERSGKGSGYLVQPWNSMFLR